MRASALSKVPPIVERPKFSFSIEANANEAVEAKVQTEDAVNRTVEMSQRESNKEKRKPNGNTLQQKAVIENMNAAKKAADKDVGRTNEAAGQAEKAKRKEMAKRRADQLKSMPSEAAFFRKSNDAAAKTRRKSVVDLTSPPPKSTVPSSGAAVPQHKRPKVRSQPRLQSASAAVSSSSATAASSSAAVPPHKRPKVRAQPRLQSSIAIGSSFKCSSFISFITRLSKSVLETDDVKALLMKESRAKFNDASDYCKYFIPLIQSEIKAMIVNAVSSKDYARVANPLHFESDVPRNIGGDFSIPKTCTGSRCIAPESIQGIMIEASLPDFRTKFSRGKRREDIVATIEAGCIRDVRSERIMALSSAKCASRSLIGASNVKRGDLLIVSKALSIRSIKKNLLALLYQQKEHMCLIRSEGLLATYASKLL